jgi:hypothetical protein
MSRRISLPGLVAISTAARSELARAQASSGSQDVQIYAGEMFGDRLTDTPLSGRTPRLDDGQGLNTAETTLGIGYQF